MINRTTALRAFSCVIIAICLIPSAAFAVDDSSSQTANGDISTNQTSMVDANYRIAEEDVLRMDVWGEPQLSNQQMQVTPDGNINVAFLGEMQAVGLTQTELTKQIAKKLQDAQILINPKIQITIITLHQPTARVLGEVQRPGSFTFKDGDTILDLVAQAGSYTQNAMLEKATLTRKNSKNPISINLRDMFHGDLSMNMPIAKGDSIYIPPEDYQNKIYVLGYVMKPGIYSLKDKTNLLSAISLAGGASERAALKSTAIFRGDPAKPERVSCDMTKLFGKGDLTQNIELRSGDVVFVPETKTPNWSKISQIISTLTNFTYLRGLKLF